MEEVNTTEATKAIVGKQERKDTHVRSTSATTSTDNKSLVSGLQAANTSMHALDHANRELIEALEEAEREIERYIRLYTRYI